MLKILYMNFHVILTESEVVYNTHFTKKRKEGNVQRVKNLSKVIASATSFHLGFHKGILE